VFLERSVRIGSKFRGNLGEKEKARLAWLSFLGGFSTVTAMV
jgi:hypothetical protein